RTSGGTTSLCSTDDTGMSYEMLRRDSICTIGETMVNEWRKSRARSFSLKCASPDAGKTGSVPEPLKIPPSRARRQLQARLDAKK
ncbi:hypothetical protein KC346_g23362, partial [Hortaea werneckii]